MSYIVCPTCGYFIGQKLLEFENKKEEIEKSTNLTNDEKVKETTKAIMSIKLRRYCCRMRLMTYKDYIDIF